MDEQKKRKLAIFDFDGVITSKDSMFEFIRYVNGPVKLYLSFIIFFPWFLFAKIGLYSKEKAKKKLLSFHFKGFTKEYLEKKGVNFSLRRIPLFLREKALDQIQFHRRHSHVILIITASLDFWTENWFKRMGVHYISTLAEYENEVFTGNFHGLNCNGPEKLRRLKEKFDLAEFEQIFAYGDSKGDKDILKIADKIYWKPFRGKYIVPRD